MNTLKKQAAEGPLSPTDVDVATSHACNLAEALDRSATRSWFADVDEHFRCAIEAARDNDELDFRAMMDHDRFLAANGVPTEHGTGAELLSEEVCAAFPAYTVVNSPLLRGALREVLRKFGELRDGLSPNEIFKELDRRFEMKPDDLLLLDLLCYDPTSLAASIAFAEWAVATDLAMTAEGSTLIAELARGRADPSVRHLLAKKAERAAAQSEMVFRSIEDVPQDPVCALDRSSEEVTQLDEPAALGDDLTSAALSQVGKTKDIEDFVTMLDALKVPAHEPVVSDDVCHGSEPRRERVVLLAEGDIPARAPASSVSATSSILALTRENLLKIDTIPKESWSDLRTGVGSVRTKTNDNSGDSGVSYLSTEHASEEFEALQLVNGEAVKVEWYDEDLVRRTWFGTVRKAQGKKTWFASYVSEMKGADVVKLHEPEPYPIPDPNVMYTAFTKLKTLPRVGPMKKIPAASSVKSKRRKKQGHKTILSPANSHATAASVTHTTSVQTLLATGGLSVKKHKEHGVTKGKQRAVNNLLEGMKQAAGDKKKRVVPTRSAASKARKKQHTTADGEDAYAPLPQTAVWAAEQVSGADLAPFQRGHGVIPPVAALKGRDVIALQMDDAHVSSLAKLGIVSSTRKGHRRILRQMAQLPPHLYDAPLATALSEWANLRRTERRWQWSTTTTFLASTQGALQLLPLYTKAPASIELKSSPEWRQTMRTCTRKANEEIGYQPKPATFADIERAMEEADTPRLKWALLIAWLTAARGGCTLLLRRENLVLKPKGDLVVMFRRGKGVKARGPYSVHTKVPSHYLQDFAAWLDSHPGGWCFPQVKGEHIKLGLRKVDPQLEQRSIRRGALITLAKTGASEETLMRFSGHTNTRTLRRYLGWGSAEGQAKDLMTKAAAAAAKRSLPKALTTVGTKVRA